MNSILSICTPNYQILANATWPNKVEYAMQHGYGFLCKNNNFTLPHASGEKLPFIKQYIHAHPDVEWVWWLDIDTLITNHHIRIEDRIDNNYHFIISKDLNGINAGSFFIRNSPQGLELLDWMIEVYPTFEKQTGFFAEQTAMEAALHIEKFRNITKIVPQRSINSYHEHLNHWTKLGPDAIWERGDFVVHFPGTTMEQRMNHLVPMYYNQGILKRQSTFSHVQRIPLTEIIRNRTGNRVVEGPFVGMTVVHDSKWGDGDTAAKLLGIYECELFPSIEKAIELNPDLVVNVGCAEGFFGIGVGMRTGADVVLVDIDSELLKIAERNAVANDLNKFSVSTESNQKALQKFLEKGKRPFLFMDCEGHEHVLLNPQEVPQLSNTVIIVESHDCFKPGLLNELESRFSETHDIQVIRQGSKNPYHPLIDDFSDEQKMLVVCEFRPSTMSWLFMVPKGLTTK